MRISAVAAVMSAVAGAASPAAAVVLSGTFTNTNAPAAAIGRCAPAARTVSIGPGLGVTVGTSNFGDFVATASHCINPPLPAPYADGLFSFDFGAGNTLVGSYFGMLAATASPAQFANTQNYTVTGGTGRVLGASGSFTGLGTVTFAQGGAPSSFQTLAGNITAPGVPEPGAWMLLIAGFGMTGAVMRRAGRIGVA